MESRSEKSLPFAGIFYFLTILATFNVTTLFGQPKEEVVEWKKNFPYTKRGAVLLFTYDIRNVGDQPLLIHGYEVACSCTTVSFGKAPVPPGSVTQVSVSFNTTSVYGKQQRDVILYTNGNHPLKLRFKGTVSKN